MSSFSTALRSRKTGMPYFQPVMSYWTSSASGPEPCHRLAVPDRKLSTKVRLVPLSVMLTCGVMKPSM